MEVRSAIQTIALEHRRRYGYRRITAELHRRGMHVNLVPGAHHVTDEHVGFPWDSRARSRTRSQVAETISAGGLILRSS